VAGEVSEVLIIEHSTSPQNTYRETVCKSVYICQSYDESLTSAVIQLCYIIQSWTCIRYRH